ncbi:MAG: HesA/MoeB/ThiF family protein [Gammaproteobacteria bacterium]|nr:HesA/MoeB/ThiF family protein [Gammaproteobacteria bacterium]
MSDRYSRQILVPQIGTQGQQQIAAARVLLVGAGGLGCQVGSQLVGAGVGALTIVDHDRVSLSNLHRQFLFRESDLGSNKATAAARELQARNSAVEIAAVTHRLSPENVAELVQNADLVVDAGDNFAVSYLLSDACEGNTAMISASVNRSFGYVGVFCSPGKFSAPSLRAVFPKLPRQSQSCDVVGVTGPAVGIIGSFQAQECLKVLCNDAAQLNGQLLYLDLWNYSQQIVNCRAASTPQSRVELIGTQALEESDLVVDVRNADEVAARPQPFRVDRALPLSQLLAEPELSDSRVVCCCQSGQRALIAAQALLDAGQHQVAAMLPADEE